MKLKRFFAALLCLALVASLATVVLATSSTLLFEDEYGGYECYGYGSFTSTEGKATFQTYTNRPSHIPESECYCSAEVWGYTNIGEPIYWKEYGTTSALARARTVNDSVIINYIECAFSFIDEYYGSYTLR